MISSCQHYDPQEFGGVLLRQNAPEVSLLQAGGRNGTLEVHMDSIYL